MQRFKIKPLMGLLSSALVTLGAAMFAPAIHSAHMDPAFYEVSPEIALGAAGSIVHIEPVRGAPLGASAYRLLYRPTNRRIDRSSYWAS